MCALPGPAVRACGRQSTTTACAVTAGLGGDVALLAGIAVFSAALVFGGNLIANVLYGVVDPRIRKGGAHA